MIGLQVTSASMRAEALPVRGVSPVAAALSGLAVLLVSAVVGAIAFGRYPVGIDRVMAILFAQLVDISVFWTPVDEQVVVIVRLPRILSAALVGAGLGTCGAALQGVYRNPLVDPSIVGAAPGAAFGGALSILVFGGGGMLLVGFAFAGGLAALALVHLIAGSSGRLTVLALVLAGVVVGAFFGAMVSLTQYLANPETTLPAIVYWLMGSFATANWDRLGFISPLIAGGALVLMLLRHRIDVLSLGDEDARALGVDVTLTRCVILVVVAVVTGAVVAACGIVGWVGLLAPHLARMLVGPAHRNLLPAAALTGALVLIVVDTLARTLTAAEVPLSVLTAVLGTPVFAILLNRLALQGWNRERD
jgi:iron complex transport system permease protein